MRNDDVLSLVEPRFDFAKCTPKCTASQMNTRFLEDLSRAYDIYPFRLTSAFRTPEWERKNGRSGTSAHCLGKAVDIHTPDSITRYYVLDALKRAGFVRFGIGKTFIHVDDDVCRTRPANCLFLEF